jgi:hypothetical protein
MDRKELRDLLLGTQPQRKSQVVKVVVNEREVEVEIRCPSMKDEETISKKTVTLIPPSRPGGETKVETFPAQRRIWTAIKCCFVPGTEQRIFEPSDADALLNAPADSWLAKLASAAEKAIQVDAEAVEGNSDATATDNS